MSRFRIDHPDIDTDRLEARVREAVERKRGSRYTQQELDRLRATRLRPRLRREDLPRGFLERLSAVRPLLPEIAPAPAPESSSAVKVDRRDDVEPIAVGAALWGSGSGGLKGTALRVVRRLARPVLRSLVNLEHAFEQFRAETIARVERAEDRQSERLERSYDRLKDDLDRRIDRTGDWAGGQLSDLTGALDRRADRQLQLLHNLVLELSHARLQIEELQDRLYETRQELALMQERERSLERLVLEKRPS